MEGQLHPNTLAAMQLLHFHSNILSDEQCKRIKQAVNPRELAHETVKRGGPFSLREIELLVEQCKEMDGQSFGQSDSWDEDLLSKYADYVYNAHYTYKPEAKQLDPSIDPNQEHIGPMAQDLEKVNPAVVITDPKSGYKSVDAGRVALMNAGAIADLAREVRELKGA